jgi:hypothetical protein
MAMTEAQRLIAVLSARGWSYGKIGDVFGRDASLIRQGAIGKKPLNNLLPGLESLVNSGKGPSLALTERIQAAPRLTKAGTPARVRGEPPGPAMPRPPKVGEQRILPGGQVYERVRSTDQARNYLAGLSPNQHVTISYKGKDGQWHTLGKKGGYKVSTLQNRLRGPRGGQRTWASVVNEIAGEVYGEDEAAEVVSAVELVGG